MSSRLRPEPYTRWRVDVPTRLAALIEHEFFNPITGKPEYGKRSQLIRELLERHLRERGYAVPTSDVEPIESET